MPTVGSVADQIVAGAAIAALGLSGWGLYLTTHYNNEQKKRLADAVDATPTGQVLQLSERPAEGGSITRWCVRASGSQRRIPADGDLWLVLRARNNPGYYVTPIAPDNLTQPPEDLAAQSGKPGSIAWVAPLAVGRPDDAAEVGYTLTLYYANSRQSVELAKDKKRIVLDSLPGDLRELDRVNFEKKGSTSAGPGETCNLASAA